VDNIKVDSIYNSIFKLPVDLRERMGWGGTDWIDLDQDRDQLRAL
jgi:hypothetical protein